MFSALNITCLAQRSTVSEKTGRSHQEGRSDYQGYAIHNVNYYHVKIQ